MVWVFNYIQGPTCVGHVSLDTDTMPEHELLFPEEIALFVLALVLQAILFVVDYLLRSFCC